MKNKKFFIFIISIMLINLFGIIINLFEYDIISIILQAFLLIQCYFVHRSNKSNVGNKNIEKVIKGLTILFLIIIPFQVLDIYYLFTTGNEMPERLETISLSLIIFYILIFFSYMVITDDRYNYKFYIKVTIKKALNFVNLIKKRRK